MLFITIIIALALELMVTHSVKIKKTHWLIAYREWIISLFRKNLFWDGPIGVLAILVIPVVLISLLQTSSFYNDSLYGLTGLILGVLLLVYSFRYSSLDQAIESLSVSAVDSEEQFLAAEKAAMGELLGQSQPAIQYRYSVLTEAVMVQANERLFAVIFWFLIFGPAGALAYRLSWFMYEHPLDPGTIEPSDDDLDAASYRLFGILSWVPARICAAGYALAGGFEDALSEWSELSMKGKYDFCKSNYKVLAKTGMAALHIGRYESTLEDDDLVDKMVSVNAVKAARALVLRTLLLACVIISIVTITGWIVT
ncbi:hypothetical protein MNBD_GAMMA12-1471 [hydrothermal vent metagenome]|uniref:Adenosylcobinamide-phosphate synthase n=1 Tax=hydrothermal vent metagenome TaxID=652676 RepID=A0A3B0YPM5_9ZZZZ